MSKPATNPYPVDSAEFSLWEHWHQGFFAEPVHAQLYSIEEDLRKAFSILMETLDQIPAPAVRETVRTQLHKIEAAILLLDESAEHAYQRVVSLPGIPAENTASDGASDDGSPNGSDQSL